MGKNRQPLRCNFCEKEAVVFLDQIIGINLYKIHLCLFCANQEGILENGSKFNENTLKGNITDLTCEQCGLTNKIFNKTGKLGCPICYVTFNDIIIYPKKEKSSIHIGKIPKYAIIREKINSQIKTLNKELKLVIKDENYEKAIIIKDQIKLLKNKLKI